MAEYIKREATIKAIHDVYEYGFPTASGAFDDFATKIVPSLLNSIPAADVAPVVHGRWDGDNCTACKLPWKWNMVQDADDWGYFDPMPDYCPNCGARMDGGEENV